jgi:hypothetical protein
MTGAVSPSGDVSVSVPVIQGIPGKVAMAAP